MSGLMNNVVELSRLELVFLKDVFISVREHTDYDDMIDELEEAIDLIDTVLYMENHNERRTNGTGYRDDH